MKVPTIVSSRGGDRGSEQNVGPQIMNYCNRVCVLYAQSNLSMPISCSCFLPTKNFMLDLDRNQK